MEETREREYITDAGFAWRIARAYPMKSRRIGFIFLGVIALLLGLVSLLGLEDILSLWTSFLAVVAFFTVAHAALLLVIYRTQQKQIPTGSRFTARLGEHSLDFSGPLGTAEVDYSTYRRVFKRGAFVFAEIAGSTTYTALPQQLLPGEEYDRLVALVAGAKTSGSTNHPIALPQQYVIDPGYAARFSRAATTYAITRPAILVMLILLAVPGIIGLIMLPIGLLLREDVTPVVAPIVFSITIIGTTLVFVISRTRRVARAHFPVGSIYGLGLTTLGVALSTPRYSAEVPFERLRGVRRWGEFVVLISKPGYTLIPGQLVPPEVEQELRAAIPA